MRYLFLSFMLHSSMAFATGHRDFDRNNLRLLYTSPLLDATAMRYTQAQIADLGTLLDGGMNSIILPFLAPYFQDANGAFTVVDADFQTWANTLTSMLYADPTLRDFRYFISIIVATWNEYSICLDYPTTCNANLPLPVGFQHYLDLVISLARNNPNLFVGYYTFDEPTRADNVGLPVDKWFQEKVYNYIRSADPDLVARPVAIANTYSEFTATTAPDILSRRGSINALDLVLIDQYTSDTTANVPYAVDENHEENWLKLWRDNNQLTKPVVFVLKAFDDQAATCHFGNVSRNELAYNDAVAAVFSQPLNREGYGYFSYSANIAHGDIGPALDDCIDLRTETITTTWPDDHTSLAITYLAGTNKVANTAIPQVAEAFASSASGSLGLTVFDFMSDGTGFTRHVPNPIWWAGSAALAYLSVDINGDGTTDVLQAWSNGAALGLQSYTSNGKQLIPTWSTANSGVVADASSKFLTLQTNWDACTDVVQLWNNHGRVGLNTIMATCNSSNPTYLLNQVVSDAGASFMGQFLPVDVDGDLRTDFVQIWSNGPYLAVTPYLSFGGGYTIGTSNSTLGQDLHGTMLTGRVDAGPTDDLIYTSCNGANHLRIDTFTSNGTNYSWRGFTPDTGQGCGAVQFLTGDFNRDQLTDVLQLFNYNGSLGWIIYLGNGTTNVYANGGTFATGPTGTFFAVDLNQDGRTDLVQEFADSGRVRFVGYLMSASGVPTLTENFVN